MKLIVTVLVLTIANTYAQNFKCPPKDGSYEDPVQCDKYYVCDDEVPTAKLCPDGLVFDQTIRKPYKCEKPFTVDCGDRTVLQPPQPTKLCPRRNGFFAHPDEQVCGTFYNCIDGEAIEVKCTKGLHFDDLTGICTWPATSGRQNCDETITRKLKDGFECSKDGQTDANGQLVIHPKFAHPTDCQRFYVCLNGDEPRELGCQVGEVYNDESQRCDAPENVTGCEDWYKDETAEPKGAPPKRA